MGSAGFLIIFAAVNTSNLKIHKKTSSNKYIPILGVITCLFALAALIWQTALTSPINILILIILVGSAFAIEIIYTQHTGRRVKTIIKPTKKMKDIKKAEEKLESEVREK